MEVKSIFMNLILKNYEKQDASNAARTEKTSGDSNKDTVTISPRASKRLFRDIMENSLKKGLNEGLPDEN
jgi:hypothetical protein